MATLPERQLSLPSLGQAAPEANLPYRDHLARLLAGELDFHAQASDYASHGLHAFPAKFPPQLPRACIAALTRPGEVVLDPMLGSGTTLLEALLAGRAGIGLDIDPLGLLLGRVKAHPPEVEPAAEAGLAALERARQALRDAPEALDERLAHRLDAKTRAFLDYWFLPQTQRELEALREGIERVVEADVRAFLALAFSAVIITKSGGVSLARDLAHTRPHRVADKAPRSALVEFEKRLKRNVQSIQGMNPMEGRARVACADAQALPLADASVHLIVTSPPYASNAIDYMRAHKFSLVWLGYALDELGLKRKAYIGGETVERSRLESLSPVAAKRVAAVAACDAKKGAVLHRYYSEMARCLREMYRVLAPGRAAVVVVGTSLMRGVDTRTQDCLADLGAALGFEVVGIATRHLDRDRRMMPARWGGPTSSPIERRMHEEYVIGFLKPETTRSWSLSPCLV